MGDGTSSRTVGFPADHGIHLICWRLLCFRGHGCSQGNNKIIKECFLLHSSLLECGSFNISLLDGSLKINGDFSVLSGSMFPQNTQGHTLSACIPSTQKISFSFKRTEHKVWGWSQWYLPIILALEAGAREHELEVWAV